MRFSSFIVLGFAAALANAAAVPEARPLSGKLQARDCDCDCESDCRTNCSNGFISNPVGYSVCVLACGDTCGCGPNTLCCEDGSSCEGSGCCAA